MDPVRPTARQNRHSRSLGMGRTDRRRPARAVLTAGEMGGTEDWRRKLNFCPACLRDLAAKWQSTPLERLYCRFNSAPGLHSPTHGEGLLYMNIASQEVKGVGLASCLSFGPSGSKTGEFASTETIDAVAQNTRDQMLCSS